MKGLFPLSRMAAVGRLFGGEKNGLLSMPLSFDDHRNGNAAIIVYENGRLLENLPGLDIKC